ncbi:MAG: heparinase II/III-family protein [Proteobacteria bacterium]|nr:heparinase II/III-family protein [Pseudomonadota bacterium]
MPTGAILTHSAFRSALLAPSLVPTLWRLGPVNIGRVGLYRVRKRIAGYGADGPPLAPFLLARQKVDPAPVLTRPQEEELLTSARRIASGKLLLFSRLLVDVGNPPAWANNPLTNVAYATPFEPSHRIPFFKAAAGDIKLVWEASRFSWAPILARAHRLAPDEGFGARLVRWIEDWVRANPPYFGANWTCGQETSLRLLNLLLAAAFLDEDRAPTPGFVDLVRLHLRRIRITLSYAKAQDNNHGTSEAAALLIGGAWLSRYSNDGAGARWHRLGRRTLVERIDRLFLGDGTFSQYSVTYQRMVLDTIALVLWWVTRLGLPTLPPRALDRVRRGANWLFQLVEPHTGDCPNLGANDGTLPFGWGEEPYRDFRPAVDRIALLLDGRRAFSRTAPDSSSSWLGLVDRRRDDRPVFERANLSASDGGIATIRSTNESFGLLRLPIFKFRPSHADALHFDLWAGRLNILRDDGSYSYSTGDAGPRAFGGAPGHNLIEFDGEDQMPRLGRFLFGSWLKGDGIVMPARRADVWFMAGGYQDWRGRRHHRMVEAEGRQWRIIDTIERFKQATLRWRLAPEYQWTALPNGVESGAARISVTADGPVTCRIAAAEEARYYLDKQPIPVLEARVSSDVRRIVTTIELTARPLGPVESDYARPSK